MAKLQITFTGLCLFVPDSSNNKMHVLLPGTEAPHHAHVGVKPHEMRLFFDPAYLFGATFPTQPANHPHPVYVHASLQRRRLDLNLGSGFNPAITSEIVQLKTFTGKGVPRKWLDDAKPGEELGARVTLTTGKAGKHEPGAKWKLKTAKPNLPNKIIWEIDGVTIPADGLKLVLPSFDANPDTELPPLRAVDDVVALEVFHSLGEELPPDPAEVPKPPRKTPATHFAAFYDLFDDPAEEPIPTFEDVSKGASPFTCMLAQAPPE